MTSRQIELARHALGLPNKKRTSYRNHFVAGAGHTDYDEWIQMCKEGNAVHRIGTSLSGGDDVFFLTFQGAKAALMENEHLERKEWLEAAR